MSKKIAELIYLKLEAFDKLSVGKFPKILKEKVFV